MKAVVGQGRWKKAYSARQPALPQPQPVANHYVRMLIRMTGYGAKEAVKQCLNVPAIHAAAIRSRCVAIRKAWRGAGRAGNFENRQRCFLCCYDFRRDRTCCG